jgi:Tfp pilus assembly protein PilO
VTKKLDAQMITIIALVVSAVLVAAGGYFMVVSPQQSKATKVATEIDTAQTEFVVAQGASARPVPFNASDLFRLANAMPPATDMPGILLGLRHLATRSSVKLTSLRPNTAVPLALGYSAVPVAITLTGNYHQITKFLSLVRTNVRLVRGTQLRVGGRLFDTDSVSLQQGQVGDQLNATMTLVPFIFTGQLIATATPGSTTPGSTTTTTTTTSH